MTDIPDNTQCMEKIAELLSNYEDGWDIFKKADNDGKKVDWDYPVHIKPDSQNKNLPTSRIILASAVIGIIAKEKYDLDTYPNSFQMITAEQMMDAYTTNGMPVTYNHWAYGKQSIGLEKSYKQGQMGLAYEIVLNTDPCLVYLMEANNMTMQLLVIAHAAYGHNSFFKGNNLFNRFTQPGLVLDDREKLKKLVATCEEKYGVERVEALLDSCRAIQAYAVDRYVPPSHRSPARIKADKVKSERQRLANADYLMDHMVKPKTEARKAFEEAALHDGLIPEQKRVNILRFIADNAPDKEEWERQIMRGICDEAKYFHPQRQTQVGNEGWATRWHYRLMYDLYEMKLIDEGMMIEFLKSHTNVIAQPMVGDKRYSGINPYALGFAIYIDIERMCTNPNDEDRKWFPWFAGNNKPLATTKSAREECRDDDLIQRYLSPKLMRDFRLFAICDDDSKDEIEVSAIHDERGYGDLREKLAAQYRLSEREPNIELYTYDRLGDRSLTLVHHIQDGKLLSSNTQEMMKHLHALWGMPVYLHSINEKGEPEQSFECPWDEQPNKPYRRLEAP
jgi:stage V sporulation protein R